MGLPNNIVRDQNIDYLKAKIWVSALQVVNSVGSLSFADTTARTGSLSVGFSVGSPTYVGIPSSRFGGIQLATTNTTVDYLWRIPSEVDKKHGLYFRHHWTSSISGLTPTVGYAVLFQTISEGNSLVTSPTTVLNQLTPVDSNGGASGTPFVYNLTGRGGINPIATGIAANQLMQDTVEALHIVIKAQSVNWPAAYLANPIVWLGMDIEYTPRRTFGDGSRREARNLETNLGFQLGQASDY